MFLEKQNAKNIETVGYFLQYYCEERLFFFHFSFIRLDNKMSFSNMDEAWLMLKKSKNIYLDYNKGTLLAT